MVTVAAALAAATGARAQNQPSATAPVIPRVVLSPDSLIMDVRVVQVVSGGSWVVGARSGHYRVIVMRDGGDADAPHHTTYVQWLERHGLSEKVEVVATIDLQSRATHWFQLLSPEIKLARADWIMHVEAADAPMRPSKKRITFTLGPPGVVRLR